MKDYSNMEEMFTTTEKQLKDCQKKLAAYLDFENKFIQAQANANKLQADLVKVRGYPTSMNCLCG